MRAGDEDIALQLAGRTFLLRPTLRAATRLERRHVSFLPILKAIDDGHLGVIAEVIRETAASPHSADECLAGLRKLPLSEALTLVTPGAMAVALALAGFDGEAKAAATPRTPITFADYHAKLYRIATGWLGWTPEVTWNATPTEITEAYQGRTELLQAIFGKPEKPADVDLFAAPDPDGIAKLKAMSLTGQNRAR